jgi:hypothetical protein
VRWFKAVTERIIHHFVSYDKGEGSLLTAKGINSLAEKKLSLMVGVPHRAILHIVSDDAAILHFVSEDEAILHIVLDDEAHPARIALPV